MRAWTSQDIRQMPKLGDACTCPYEPPQEAPVPVKVKPPAWKRALALAVPFVAGVLSSEAVDAISRGEILFPVLFVWLAGIMGAVAWRWTR